MLNSGVYILQKIYFFPCCNFFYFFLLQQGRGKIGKIFSELFILFILSPFPHILLVFFSPSGGKNGKNVFRTLYFIHIIPPPTYSFGFFTKERRKMEKMFLVLSYLNFYIFFPPTTYYFYTLFHSRVKFSEYTPLA